MVMLDVATLIILAIVGIISFILGIDHRLVFRKKPKLKVQRFLTYVVLFLIVIQLTIEIWESVHKRSLERDEINNIIFTITLSVNITKVPTIISSTNLKNLLSNDPDFPVDKYSEFFYVINSAEYRDSIKQDILNDWQFRFGNMWGYRFIEYNIQNGVFNIENLVQSEILVASVTYDIPFKGKLSQLGCSIYIIEAITHSENLDTKIETIKIELIGPHVPQERVLASPYSRYYNIGYEEIWANISMHTLNNRSRNMWSTPRFSLSDQECHLWN